MKYNYLFIETDLDNIESVLNKVGAGGYKLHTATVIQTISQGLAGRPNTKISYHLILIKDAEV